MVHNPRLASKSCRHCALLAAGWLLASGLLGSGAAAAAEELWDLARAQAEVHRLATLITAQQVRDLVATEEGLDAAVAWCRRTAVTKVYIETFRNGYLAPRELLVRARDRFSQEGLATAGCVTTTQVGKRSTGWNIITCYSDEATQQRLEEVFAFTAGVFDEIMIDDFWFTDCECAECDAGRKAKRVVVGDKSFPVAGDRWADYRCELLVQLSRERVLGAAKRVNPRAALIIKYPQWYDRFHERGYDVARETADFDRIWVGTETRDYDDERWGGTPQYEAYFLMRWLGGIGGAKCGGGWFDPYGTTEDTYVEQARQTVLAGAKESVLFCYGALLQGTAPANVERLRAEIPELLEVAGQVQRRRAVGVAAYKPPGSDPGKEPRVFDFVGMLGIPLVPCHEFPANARAAFFSTHALADPEFPARLAALIDRGVPVLVTDSLAAGLRGRTPLGQANVQVLPVSGEPKSLLAMSQPQLDAIRAPLLAALGRTFAAPSRVGLYLFDDGSWVVENFNDRAAAIELDRDALEIAPRGWRLSWR